MKLIANGGVDLFIGMNLEEIANSGKPIRIALFILRDHFMTKTYAQIAREIAALQATASKLYAIETQGAVAKVNELIAKYGLSADQLKFGAASAASAPVAKAPSAAPGVKYSDGQGRVWGGRGPRPAWLRSAIAAGRSLESFLAAGAADVVAALTQSVGATARKSVVKKPAAAGAVKYVNPKTGAGWSGRGPRPQWLKDALKKRGSKIEDFLGDKPAATAVAVAPAAPAPAPVAPAKKAAAKKATAPAKKGVAKKVAAKKASAKVAAKKAANAPAKAASVAPAKKAVVTKVAAKSASAKAPAKAPAKKAIAKAPAKKAAAASGAPAAPAVASAVEAPAPATSA